MKEGIEFFPHELWHPFTYFFGLESPFFALNKNIIIATWIVILIMAVILGVIRYFLKYKNGIIHYIALSFIQSFADLSEQTLGSVALNHLTFIVTLFVFIFFCSIASLVPYLEEPTQDLNTTLALGIISFVYVQVHSIKALGFRHYLQEYLTPFPFMFPLHVMSKLATIISLSFRLFGNIFGGAIISKIFFGFVRGSIFLEIAALPINIVLALFFGLFEGFLQAFVFSILTLTYLAIAIKPEEAEGAL